MKDWWNSISIREQAIVVIAGLILSVIVLDTFVVEAYRMNQRQLDENIIQAQDDLAWMKQAVKRLPEQTQSSAQKISGRLISFVDQQISRSGLKKQMQQMTPIQNHSVRLRLSEVEFTQLLRFLTDIENAVRIEEARILPSTKSGVVDASLVVSIRNSNE